jgi:hypothetical protein
MINFLSKSLVMVHAILSIGAFFWAFMVFWQGRDFGWSEPYLEVLEYTSEGKPKVAFRRASEYDKSYAAVKEAERTRDRVYARVKQPVADYRAVEPYLANNHFVYMTSLERLKSADGPIEVRRLKDNGVALDVPDIGKPVPEDKPLPQIVKAYKAYEVDRKKVLEDCKAVEVDIRNVVTETKKLTAQLTGTDEANRPIHPGLYYLKDMEFAAQQELKKEIEATKPEEFKAIRQANDLRDRRMGLQATLDKLKAPPPGPMPKDDRKDKIEKKKLDG